MVRNFKATWDFSDVAATETRFRGILTADESSAENLCIQTQIARTFGLRNRFEEAHDLLSKVDEALKMLDATSLDAIEVNVRSRLERGRVYRSSKRPVDARPHFIAATDMALSAHFDELAIDAMHMVALVCDDPKESLEWSGKALKLALHSDDPAARNWDASLANNIGWTYHDAGDFDNAMIHFQTALAARERMGDSKTIHIAKWMIARTHRSRKQHAEALAILHVLDATNSEDGYVSEELAENYEALDQHEKAKPFFLQAWTKLKDDSSVDAARLQRMHTLART
ncbi:hypothetical protein DYB32_002346 [Aphanomyces invadans]|uniref:Uncharacterized protein n=1 Tax=Aphanomyces invadans TaxID=157072 RepID=A0A418B3N5_9STRA|nr:hypothetical protein DYB32_002346 [Aphanomyces invadans]